MATITCTICEQNTAAGRCADCAKPVCKNCGVSCQRCRKPICPDHVQITARGRKLCGSCMDARNAARAKHKAGQRAEGEPARTTPAPARRDSRAGLASATPKPQNKGNELVDLSFEALMDGEPVLSADDDIDDAKEDDRDDPVLEAGRKAAAKTAKLLDELERIPERRAKTLEVDEDRPILTHSAQQAPGYWRFVAAVLFFVIACVFMYRRLPSLRPILMGALAIGTAGFLFWLYRLIKAYRERL